MITAADVRNMDNMLLIPAGCTLSGRQINILHSWGIEEIEVAATEGVEESVNPLARLSPEEVERLTAQVKAQFWKLEETDPVQMEIFKLVLYRQARQSRRA